MQEAAPPTRSSPVLTLVAGCGRVLGSAVEDDAPHVGTLCQVQTWSDELVDDERREEFLAMLGHELRAPDSALREGISQTVIPSKATAAEQM